MLICLRDNVSRMAAQFVWKNEMVIELDLRNELHNLQPEIVEVKEDVIMTVKDNDTNTSRNIKR